jgi:hypothetical protein
MSVADTLRLPAEWLEMALAIRVNDVKAANAEADLTARSGAAARGLRSAHRA